MVKKSPVLKAPTTVPRTNERKINASMKEHLIVVHNAALEETPKGDIILRGVLDHEALKYIQYGPYQREVLPLKALNSLIKAFTAGEPVPDITLGMRGGGYIEKEGEYHLQESIFAIDGQQRISAALHCMRAGKNEAPHVGCTIHFNTTEESEEKLFRILNTKGARLSPNVLIRNLQANNQAVEMLIHLSGDRDFALYDRVSWQQRMKRNELISASTLLKVTAQIHATYGPGTSNKYDQAAAGVENTMLNHVGRRIMAANIKTFFDTVDGAWDIRNVVYKEGATYLKSGFLLALAWVISSHKNFWDEHSRMTVPLDLRRKLSSFPVSDRHVKDLASSASTRRLLGGMIIDHLNHNKKSHRLIPFKPSEIMVEEQGVSEEEKESVQVTASVA